MILKTRIISRLNYDVHENLTCSTQTQKKTAFKATLYLILDFKIKTLSLYISNSDDLCGPSATRTRNGMIDRCGVCTLSSVRSSAMLYDIYPSRFPLYGRRSSLSLGLTRSDNGRNLKSAASAVLASSHARADNRRKP